MGTTILIVWATRDGGVACRFRPRNGGAPNWPFIVDALPPILEAISEELREPIELPGPGDRTLGRGALIEMSTPAYRRARALLLKDEHAGESFRSGAFVIQEDYTVRRARRALRARRKRPVKRRKFVRLDPSGRPGYAGTRS